MAPVEGLTGKSKIAKWLIPKVIICCEVRDEMDYF